MAGKSKAWRRRVLALMDEGADNAEVRAAFGPIKAQTMWGLRKEWAETNPEGAAELERRLAKERERSKRPRRFDGTPVALSPAYLLTYHGVPGSVIAGHLGVGADEVRAWVYDGVAPVEHHAALMALLEAVTCGDEDDRRAVLSLDKVQSRSVYDGGSVLASLMEAGTW